MSGPLRGGKEMNFFLTFLFSTQIQRHNTIILYTYSHKSY